MDPQYFAHALTVYEAEAYLRGVARRNRAGWEQARYIAHYICATQCKNWSFSNLRKFPWEEQGDKSARINDSEELKNLRGRAEDLDLGILTQLTT
jgi:hypothetical protein